MKLGLLTAPFPRRSLEQVATWVTHHCSPNDIRVFWMNNDTYNMTAVFQTNILPAFTTIIAAPHTAKPFTYISPHGIFSFPCIYNCFIGGSYSNGAN